MNKFGEAVRDVLTIGVLVGLSYGTMTFPADPFTGYRPSAALKTAKAQQMADAMQDKIFDDIYDGIKPYLQR